MTEENKVIVFKNRIEVKILLIVYALILLPIFVILVISLIKDFAFSKLVFLIFPFFFLLVLFFINRFNVTFDYQKEEIRFTNYFSKTRKIPFKDVKVDYVKSKTTIPWDFDYIFYYNKKRLFKISSINFEGQTKKSVNYLNQLLSDAQKSILESKN